jgi:prepilin-type N-terminal cleavage/methylation domain-containing protein
MRYSARTGMTLMELMVALVVTGVVATIGAETFVSIIDHRRVIVEATRETERASALREMLRSWIASGTIQITTGGAQSARSSIAAARIAAPTIASPNSSQQLPAITAAVSTGDELTFRTNALTPTSTSNTLVRLFVDGDPATPDVGLTIEYQASTATPLQRMQLDSTIVMMTVEFLDKTTNRWYPYSEAATITPIAVRLYFPPVDNYYVPALLQLPMLFVLPAAQAAATATTGRGGP